MAWLVGEFTTHFTTYFSGDWNNHWGYGDFDPQPCGFGAMFVRLRLSHPPPKIPHPLAKRAMDETNEAFAEP